MGAAGIAETPVYLESGSRRTFAGAIDWPGWCRSGRDEASALEALLSYGPLCWPKNAILVRAGISRSVPIAPLGAPSKSGAITVFTHLRPVPLA